MTVRFYVGFFLGLGVATGVWGVKFVGPEMGVIGVMSAVPVILITVFTAISGWDKA